MRLKRHNHSGSKELCRLCGTGFSARRASGGGQPCKQGSSAPSSRDRQVGKTNLLEHLRACLTECVSPETCSRRLLSR